MRGTVEKKRICVYVKQETIDYINKVATEIDRSQGWVVDEAIKAGVRDKVKIMIGGAPITDEYCKQIGADAYTLDAASAADKAVELLSK